MYLEEAIVGRTEEINRRIAQDKRSLVEIDQMEEILKVK